MARGDGQSLHHSGATRAGKPDEQGAFIPHPGRHQALAGTVQLVLPQRAVTCAHSTERYHPRGGQARDSDRRIPPMSPCSASHHRQIGREFVRSPRHVRTTPTSNAHRAVSNTHRVIADTTMIALVPLRIPPELEPLPSRE
jgi:hypothetical protein